MAAQEQPTKKRRVSDGAATRRTSEDGEIVAQLAGNYGVSEPAVRDGRGGESASWRLGSAASKGCSDEPVIADGDG